ncbi:MAG: PKD domain-containing protein [Nitrospirae bacterium]|nr:PKD domain-containing protein [Nitrospirota bacterium]MCL5976948.1 PKD domain-containing protein [Nitrospirota bacterium]
MIRLIKGMLLGGFRGLSLFTDEVKRSRRMGTVPALIVLLLLGVSAAYAEDASVVRATQVDGTVLKNGSPMKDGDIIQRDDKIEAKANSAAVLTWSNGSIVQMYQDTTLILQGVMFEADRKMETTLLKFEKGRIFAKAQVPEHLFTHFEINVGGSPVKTQGSEFALKYDDAKKEITLWSLLGRVVVDAATGVLRVDDGQQAVQKIGGGAATAVAMQDRMKSSLTNVSKKLGGSLLIEEELSSGGPLKVKIGGVRNRRGDAPYTVKFKAIIGGGSGNIKSIRWDFGDGESVMGKEAQHTFTQGVYAVVLTVEDESGQKATAQLNISVEEACGC